MPYIKPERREIVRKTRAVESVGEINFLKTEEMLTKWNADPHYDTLDTLAKEVGFTTEQLAFLEMYMRVGRPYENEAIERNGDLEGYQEAYKKLNEMSRERFNKRIKYVPNEESK